jgi:hypothetical protein
MSGKPQTLSYGHSGRQELRRRNGMTNYRISSAGRSSEGTRCRRDHRCLPVCGIEHRHRFGVAAGMGGCQGVFHAMSDQDLERGCAPRRESSGRLLPGSWLVAPGREAGPTSDRGPLESSSVASLVCKAISKDADGSIQAVLTTVVYQTEVKRAEK